MSDSFKLKISITFNERTAEREVPIVTGVMRPEGDEFTRITVVTSLLMEILVRPKFLREIAAELVRMH